MNEPFDAVLDVTRDVIRTGDVACPTSCPVARVIMALPQFAGGGYVAHVTIKELVVFRRAALGRMPPASIAWEAATPPDLAAWLTSYDSKSRVKPRMFSVTFRHVPDPE